MQTTINVAQAFGLVGSFYDLTPYRVDACEVAATATMGFAAGQSSTGTIADMSGTYSTFLGVFVRPHEHVNYGTSDGALVPSLACPAGATVQVAKMGRVVVEIEFSATHTVATASYNKATEEAAALTALKAVSAVLDNAAAYVDTNGGTYKFTPTSTSNTLVGKFVKGASPANAISAGNAVTYSTATESTNTITTAKVKALVKDLPELVHIPAGLDAAQVGGLDNGLAGQVDDELAALLNNTMGIALGADGNIGHRGLAVDDARPGGGEHIMFFHVAAGDERRRRGCQQRTGFPLQFCHIIVLLIVRRSYMVCSENMGFGHAEDSPCFQTDVL